VVPSSRCSKSHKLLLSYSPTLALEGWEHEIRVPGVWGPRAPVAEMLGKEWMQGDVAVRCVCLGLAVLSERSFGLFAPRSLGETSAGFFAVLGQKQKPRPRPRRWAHSLKHDFGHDPLTDKMGNPMKWVRRIPPKVSPSSRR
jgi:hypothetical protein